MSAPRSTIISSAATGCCGACGTRADNLPDGFHRLAQDRRGRRLLYAARKLRAHHLPPVEPLAVDDEGAVADGMQHALLAPREVDMGGKALEHDDVVALEDVDHLALDA